MLDVGQGPGHDFPEIGGVAHDLQVGQLMYDDIIDNLGREHHIAPAETEGRRPGSSCPIDCAES